MADDQEKKDKFYLTLQKAKTPAKQKTIRDPKTRNLYVIHYPSGAMVWWKKVQVPATGLWTSKQIGKLGQTGFDKPIISITEARRLADELDKATGHGFDVRLYELSEGRWLDPKKKIVALSVRKAFQDRLTYPKKNKGLADADIKAATIQRMERNLKDCAYVWELDVGETETVYQEVSKRMRKLEAEDSKAASLRLLTDFCVLYNFIIKNRLRVGLVNPFAGAVRPYGNNPRHVWLTLPEMKLLWNLIEALPRRHYHLGLIIKLLMLTGLRLGEVSGMCRSEIDLKELSWVIPASRMKSGKNHFVHLSPPVLAIIEKLYYSTNHEVIFPKLECASRGNGKLDVGRDSSSVGGTIRRLHESGLFQPITYGLLEDDCRWCAHDLRRSFITHIEAFADDFGLLMAQKYSSQMIAHVKKKKDEENEKDITIDEVKRLHYNMFKNVPQVRKGWNEWGSFFETYIIKGDMATLHRMQQAADGRITAHVLEEADKLAA